MPTSAPALQTTLPFSYGFDIAALVIAGRLSTLPANAVRGAVAKPECAVLWHATTNSSAGCRASTRRAVRRLAPSVSFLGCVPIAACLRCSRPEEAEAPASEARELGNGGAELPCSGHMAHSARPVAKHALPVVHHQFRGRRWARRADSCAASITARAKRHQEVTVRGVPRAPAQALHLKKRVAPLAAGCALPPSRRGAYVGP